MSKLPNYRLCHVYVILSYLYTYIDMNHTSVYQQHYPTQHSHKGWSTWRSKIDGGFRESGYGLRFASATKWTSCRSFLVAALCTWFATASSSSAHFLLLSTRYLWPRLDQVHLALIKLGEKLCVHNRLRICSTWWHEDTGSLVYYELTTIMKIHALTNDALTLLHLS